MASQLVCCKDSDWVSDWHRIEKQWNKQSNLGFDLWALGHGLRDCLLIDHILWRQAKMHSKLIGFIQQLYKVTLV